MKFGSIGEMPPSTRVTELSARTAWDAALTKSAYTFHPASTSKSQWDMLFGSFQSLTAAITSMPPHFPWVVRSAPGSLRGIHAASQHPHRLLRPVLPLPVPLGPN